MAGNASCQRLPMHHAFQLLENAQMNTDHDYILWAFGVALGVAGTLAFVLMLICCGTLVVS